MAAKPAHARRMLDTIFRREILRGQNHETRTKRRNIPTIGTRHYLIANIPIVGMLALPDRSDKMTYSTFAADVLLHGAHFAASHAERMGVSGGTMAKWLSRLAMKPRAVQGATA